MICLLYLTLFFVSSFLHPCSIWLSFFLVFFACSLSPLYFDSISTTRNKQVFDSKCSLFTLIWLFLSVSSSRTHSSHAPQQRFAIYIKWYCVSIHDASYPLQLIYFESSLHFHSVHFISQVCIAYIHDEGFLEWVRVCCASSHTFVEYQSQSDAFFSLHTCTRMWNMMCFTFNIFFSPLIVVTYLSQFLFLCLIVTIWQ